MMADKLKRCPFCGGEARILTDMQDTTTPVFSVVCDECESITYFGDVLDKEGTVEAWNNRPSPWHTGTPKEDGWYMLAFTDGGERFYDTNRLRNGIWEYCLIGDILEWQKIEED